MLMLQNDWDRDWIGDQGHRREARLLLLQDRVLLLLLHRLLLLRQDLLHQRRLLLAHCGCEHLLHGGAGGLLDRDKQASAAARRGGGCRHGRHGGETHHLSGELLQLLLLQLLHLGMLLLQVLDLHLQLLLLLHLLLQQQLLKLEFLRRAWICYGKSREGMLDREGRECLRRFSAAFAVSKNSVVVRRHPRVRCSRNNGDDVRSRVALAGAADCPPPL